MPAIYAHKYFGNKVEEKLKEPIKNLIEENINLFNIGLHGPDILFYYHPLSSNDINKVGYSIHYENANVFFEKAKKTILHSKNKNASCSYILGYICHFVLDSQCHPYVNEFIKKTSISHTEIEVEFDRMLLYQKDSNSFSKDITKHLIFNEEELSYIAEHYNFPNKIIKKSVKSMAFFNNILINPNPLIRRSIEFILKMTGNSADMKGLIMNYEPNPNCYESNITLKELLDNGVNKAVSLITEYYENLDLDTNLNERFNRNFE
ncbi:MAG: zinc dependent phospholipase C family protein [Clostridiales bacterium]|nr:zinc dependent phospholipase C family protein [Clostridiales bacterium]